MRSRLRGCGLTADVCCGPVRDIRFCLERGETVRLRRLLALTTFVLGSLAAAPSAQAIGPNCHGEDATIVGTPGNDDLDGTPGRDVVFDPGGLNVIVTFGGNDLIC